MSNLITNISETEKYIKQRINIQPKIGLILGSGLGNIAESSKGDIVLRFDEIPYFVRPNVEGHSGKLIIGDLYGKPSIVMQGRLHFYEGYSMQEITYPIYVMRQLGIEYLILTAASGGINEEYRDGDIVLIKDHINLMGDNPLRGQRFLFNNSFLDLTDLYNKELISIASSIAKRNRIPIHEGVYVAVSGPSYETPTEVKMLRKLGADVVGMSVVPEAIVAHYLGIKVLGVAYVSNMASGILKKQISHKYVLKIGNSIVPRLNYIIEYVVKNIKT